MRNLLLVSFLFSILLILSISVPSYSQTTGTIIINNEVINDEGGSAIKSDFSVKILGIKESNVLISEQVEDGPSTNFPARIIGFTSDTGEFVEEFQTQTNGGLRFIEDLVLGPDGNWYATSSLTHQVLKYDGSTGDFLEIFVKEGSGGLRSPTDLAFGPEGDLYVVSTSFTNKVLRYDGSTGDFVKEVVADPWITTIAFDASTLYAGRPASSDIAAYDLSGNLLGVAENAQKVGINTVGPIDIYFPGPGGTILATYGTGDIDFFDFSLDSATKTTNINGARESVVGPDGNVYVIVDDTLLTEPKVVKLDSNSFDRSDFVLDNSGGITAMTRLKGIAFGSDGNLYAGYNDGRYGGEILRYSGTDGKFLDRFVGKNSAEGLHSPKSLTFDSNGDIYVSNNGKDQVLKYDGTTGDFLGEFVVAGLGGLDSPTGLVFGPDGNLYVASISTREILRYSGTDGSFIDAFVTAGSGGLTGPEDLVFGPDGNLYVSSKFTDEILRYSGTDGSFIDAFVSTDIRDPVGIVFGPDGNLYVSSSGLNEVVRFSGSDGSFIDDFISTASRNPGGLKFGPDGNLYIVGSLSVLKYDGTSGEFIETTGNSGAKSLSGLTFGPDNNLYVSEGTDRIIVFDGNTGAYIKDLVNAKIGFLDRPAGIAVDLSGDIYVTDTDLDQVIRFDGSNGHFKDIFVSRGSGGLDDPFDAIFGPDGNLYVNSQVTDEILRYSGTDGSFIDAFVTAGLGGLEFPTGLVFGPDGNLYVNSQVTDEILRYSGTDGSFIDAFVAENSGGLRSPNDLVFGPDGNLYVVAGLTTDTNKVFRYDGNTGSFIDEFILNDTLVQRFIGFDPSNNLLVSDTSDQVLRYDGSNGEFKDFFISATQGDLRGVSAISFDSSEDMLILDDLGLFKYSKTTGKFIKSVLQDNGAGLDEVTFFTLDSNGDIYVSNSGTKQNVLKYSGTTGSFLTEFVTANSGGLDDPEGIVFGPDGNLYVSSQFTSEILRYSGTDGSFIDVFSDLTTHVPINFSFLKDLEFDSNGDLYVAVESGDRILKIDGTTGDVISEFVTSKSGGLSGIHSIEFGPDGNLYVSSQFTDEILRYSGTDGSFIDAFVSANSGGLDEPVGIEFGSDENLYVISELTNEILRYSGTDGSFIDVFGTLDPSTHQALHFDSNGDILLGDFSGRDILRHSGTDGSFQSTLVKGSSGEISKRGFDIGPDGHFYVTGAADEILRYSGTDGSFIDVFIISGSGGLDPMELGFDPSGNLFVLSNPTSSFNISGEKILKFSGSDGSFVGEVANAEKLGESTISIVSFTFDDSGNLYFTELNTGITFKVFKISTNGDIVGLIPDTNLLIPKGITVGPNGNLYVGTQHTNGGFTGDRILKFTTDGAFLEEFVSASGGGIREATEITFGPDNNLYVLDDGSERQVVKFSGTDGKFLEKLPDLRTGGISKIGGMIVTPDFEIINDSKTLSASPGTYTITSNNLSGYQTTFSGDCDQNGTISVTAGQTVICTVTNDDESSSDSCTPPSSGDWTVTSSCTISSSATANGNVIIQNNSVLTIPNGVTLDIDFENHNLTIESGSNVIIESGGLIQ